MYDHEKSDPAIVAVKPTNKAGQPAAELVEPRAGAEGNVRQQSTGRAQYRGTVSQALARIRQAARQRKKEKFTALFHHVSIDHLAEAFSELKENAAAGVDGLTCRNYEQHLERNLEDLHARVHRGAYRALPSRRVYIPKPDGRQRPIAVAALEDKIVQRATAAVLSAIYEEDFLGFSYGFRPGRSTHDAVASCMVTKPSPAVSLNRAMRSSVRRMRQGAPGVSCSPGMMPSLSQRCKVEGATPSTTAAFLIDASSPLVEDGPASKHGMSQWRRRLPTRPASKRWPYTVVRPWRLRMPAITVSG